MYTDRPLCCSTVALHASLALEEFAGCSIAKRLDTIDASRGKKDRLKISRNI